ncbi:hypothetical protein, variant 1 [Exophiala mesophila]|uniref:Histone-lysine N-methyltransferase, H3 lysine-9 specific n=1 Tax=Exophiala mesophila TaxID=212818 RepID=A0A0D1Y8T1_EXOME|nr:hypothetical protein, variant 1 [Exophiala mesophila]KIV97056.1 hypothetical protein, variant 1 [Exophiala mesophila]
MRYSTKALTIHQPRSSTNIIEISDDDEADANNFPIPPSKRHQPASRSVRNSATPGPSTSRDHSRGSPPQRTPISNPVAPSTPNPSLFTNGKAINSVFKTLSPISYPSGRLNGNGLIRLYGDEPATSPSATPDSESESELDSQATDLLQQFQGKAPSKPKPSAAVKSRPLTKNSNHAVDMSSRDTPTRDTKGSSQQPDQLLSPNSRQRLISVEVPIRVGSGHKPPTPSRYPPSSKPQTSSHHFLGVGSGKPQSGFNHERSAYPPAYFSPRVEVVIPNRVNRKQLLAELKKSTEPAEKRLSEVERCFGQTGFSKAFSVEPDLDRMRKLASKKKRTKDDLAKAPPQSIQLVTNGDLAESFSHCSISHSTAKSETRDKKRQVILISPSTAASTILTDRFKENFDPPLTFANDFNESRLHGKFQFTDHYIIRAGIKMAPPHTNHGCDCVNGQCSLSSCKCFKKTVSHKHQHQHEHDHKIYEQKRTYTQRRDGIVVLSDEYIEQELNPKAKHHEITECNEFCSCGPNCWNRVVSRGRTVPLEIFQTKKCGFGVRSSVDIVKGQFIELYLGEVITETELLRREDQSDENESSYIYSLDWFAAEKNYHIDGAYFGSAMRFVNHSCNPNTRCFTVQKHKEDKKVYYLAFFAIKDIKRGVEIRIDYSGAGGAVDEDEFELEMAGGDGAGGGDPSERGVRCRCGEKNCRKILWAHGTKARQRRRRRRGAA